LKKVIALSPDMGYAYVKLGMAYNRVGQYSDAVTNLTTAKKYFPKNPLIYNNLAVSFGMLGNISEEIRELEHAIALRPHYATARYNLGIALKKQGKRDEAMNQYREINKFDTTVAAALKKELDKKGK
jgi:Flp pilus assembly protein TadD